MPWKRWETRTITHPHFGAEPVDVFAIHTTAVVADVAREGGK